MTVAALVLAAGSGQRAGGDVPKQYAPLPGGPALLRSLQAFLALPEVTSVLAVIGDGHLDLYEEAVSAVGSEKLMQPVVGGYSRQNSSLIGLVALRERAPQSVLIHDAARPFVDASLVRSVLAGLDAAEAVVPVLPLADSTWNLSSDGAMERPLDRSLLRSAQTPQGFDYGKILAAHLESKDHEAEDDAAVAAAAGMRLAAVEGSPRNFKITTPADLSRAASRLASGRFSVRVGQGIDVHAFGPGDSVRLCGVDIPHERGLQGHSDADVGLHAVADAIFGAIGEGDLGKHFPDTETDWKDCDSRVFVQKARDLALERGLQVVHVDITLICEEPKVAGHREAMRRATAEAMGLPTDSISIKATTSEGLGFVGRGEGIAATAVVTLGPGEAA